MKRLLALAAIALSSACVHIDPDTAMFRLSSSAFVSGATLPDSTVLNDLDCHGPNMSPALQWVGAPAATQSYVVILDDYEARGGDGFIHWAAYNIPSSVTML